jgi:hypothetical protein
MMDEVLEKRGRHGVDVACWLALLFGLASSFSGG